MRAFRTAKAAEYYFKAADPELAYSQGMVSGEAGKHSWGQLYPWRYFHFVFPAILQAGGGDGSWKNSMRKPMNRCWVCIVKEATVLLQLYYLKVEVAFVKC